MNQQIGLERRSSVRMPMSLDMRVYAYGMLIASGKTVDMSAQGMLLHIQQDYSDGELDPGKYLDIQLEQVEQRTAEQWLPTRVVRKCREGIAVRLIQCGDGSNMQWLT